MSLSYWIYCVRLYTDFFTVIYECELLIHLYRYMINLFCDTLTKFVSILNQLDISASSAQCHNIFDPTKLCFI